MTSFLLLRATVIGYIQQLHYVCSLPSSQLMFILIEGVIYHNEVSLHHLRPRVLNLLFPVKTTQNLYSLLRYLCGVRLPLNTFLMFYRSKRPWAFPDTPLKLIDCQRFTIVLQPRTPAVWLLILFKQGYLLIQPLLKSCYLFFERLKLTSAGASLFGDVVSVVPFRDRREVYTYINQYV